MSTRTSRRRGVEPKEDEPEDEEVKEEEEEEEEEEKEEEEEEKEEESSPRKPEEDSEHEDAIQDPKASEEMQIINSTEPKTALEIALTETIKKREAHIERLKSELIKLKAFISKRKQTYKRKRKENAAPTRALSAYNIFVQDRFSKLAKDNEIALRSDDVDAQMTRMPPASLVAATGSKWKELSAEEKAHYEERAREDRKRYEEQMSKYQPPDKQSNRKRNKTGYNMFFSAHVLRLKNTDAGVPSERGSVARLVGNAWKQLSPEEKQYYEREADKHNGMHPIDKGDEDEDDEEKRNMAEYMHPVHHDMHMHPGMHPGMVPPGSGMTLHGQHDPRQHGYAPYSTHHMPYGQGYQQPEYGGPPPRYHQARPSHGYQGYPPAPHRHPYDNTGMGM